MIYTVSTPSKPSVRTKLTDLERERILSMHRSGMSFGEIANMLKRDKHTIISYCQSQGIKAKYLRGGNYLINRTGYGKSIYNEV